MCNILKYKLIDLKSIILQYIIQLVKQIKMGCQQSIVNEPIKQNKLVERSPTFPNHLQKLQQPTDLNMLQQTLPMNVPNLQIYQQCQNIDKSQENHTNRVIIKQNISQQLDQPKKILSSSVLINSNTYKSQQNQQLQIGNQTPPALYNQIIQQFDLTSVQKIDKAYDQTLHKYFQHLKNPIFRKKDRFGQVKGFAPPHYSITNIMTAIYAILTNNPIIYKQNLNNPFQGPDYYRIFKKQFFIGCFQFHQTLQSFDVSKPNFQLMELICKSYSYCSTAAFFYKQMDCIQVNQYVSACGNWVLMVLRLWSLMIKKEKMIESLKLNKQ